MNELTKPIRVVFNTREKGYRSKTWTAYIGIFAVMAGDAVRYSIGWMGWGALLVILLAISTVLFFKNQPMRTIRTVPWSIWAVLAWMALSTIWSAYPAITALAMVSQISTTTFALFLVGLFSWRHLLRIFANVTRFILGASLVFELIAATVVQGPIAPIFKNYSEEHPPAAAFYWTQGNLLDGERIQGIVGNSNLLGFVAMFGVIIFTVEFAIIGTKRWISAVCIIGSLAAVFLAKSVGIGFAIAAVVIAAIVALAAEGQTREVRHMYYRIAWVFAGAIGIIILIFRAAIFEFLGKSPDMTGRTGIWKSVIGLIEQRPLAGWGWISHWVPGVKPYEGLVVIDKVPYYQGHNAYLDITMQLGFIGAALFGIMFLITFIKLWRLAVRHTVALYLWPILVFIGMAVWNITESRMLLEIGWVLLAVFVIKVNEPAEMLEPIGKSTKRLRLLRFRKRLITALE